MTAARCPSNSLSLWRRCRFFAASGPWRHVRETSILAQVWQSQGSNLGLIQFCSKALVPEYFSFDFYNFTLAHHKDAKVPYFSHRCYESTVQPAANQPYVRFWHLISKFDSKQKKKKKTAESVARLLHPDNRPIS